MSARNRAYESALERRLRWGGMRTCRRRILVPNGTTDSDLLMESLAGYEDGSFPFTSLLKGVGIRG